jgi:hypothetical protein
MQVDYYIIALYKYIALAAYILLHSTASRSTVKICMFKDIGLTDKVSWISITARRCWIKYLVVSILSNEFCNVILLLLCIC